MWKKLRYVALIATVLTPIAHIHTCCPSDHLLPPPVDLYEIYENTPADCNESERGKEQKETQELQQKQTPATPAEKQNKP